MRYEYGRPLSQATTLRIGGPAFCFLEAESLDDVMEAISFKEAKNKALAIIGRGSNILAQDKGFDGVVMNLGRAFSYIEIENNKELKIGASLSLYSLVKKCAGLGLGGCEFLSGIPGSFGGAVFMNAGTRDINDSNVMREIKDVIVDVEIIDLKNKDKLVLKKEEIDFSYRSSGLRDKCILGARIRLEKGNKDSIIDRVNSYMKRREWINRLKFPSAGSVFKNPSYGDTAGMLIERCGLKRKRIGNAEISGAHANFIVNLGGATSEDVLALIKSARDSVRERFNVELELELKII